MIEKFVHAWDRSRESVKAKLSKAHPNGYEDIVGLVVNAIHSVMDEDGDYQVPDPDRIQCVHFGGYSGTDVYVIGETNYGPRTFWVVSVDYGSCGACDTFRSIKDLASTYTDEGNERAPTGQQVSQYMMLATHIVQAIKEV